MAEHPAPTTDGGRSLWSWLILVPALFLAAVVIRLPELAPHGQVVTADVPLVALPPPGPPPAVEPTINDPVAAETAERINAARPILAELTIPARPYVFTGDLAARARARSCLAAAQYYEAGADWSGQRAVAQVVLNRARHPAFPRSVCGVVFQGSERTTGCQFTFTCDGAMARRPAPLAWRESLAIADRMLSGEVFAPVGLATHYHASYVVPYWSASLDKIAQVHTHLFYRWRGGWGGPGAFRRTSSPLEPVVARLATLDPAHAVTPGGQDEVIAAPLAAAPAEAAPATASLPEVKLRGATVAASSADTLLLNLPTGTSSGSYALTALEYCKGKPGCRVMGWLGNAPAGGAPLTAAARATMAFFFVQDGATGAQMALWDCARLPRPRPDQCLTPARIAMWETVHPEAR